MTIRRTVRILLCTAALAAGGCSSDSMRFADMYPPGVDTRSVGSIGAAGPAYAPGYGSYRPAGAPVGTPVPGANVAPRGPSGWPTQPTRNPLVYAQAPQGPTYRPAQAAMPAAPLLDRTPVSSIGGAGRIGVGPARSAVARAALPPVATAVSASNPVVAAATRPRTVLEKARAALPSMPRSARIAPAPDPVPLATRVAAAKTAAGWSGEGGRVTVGEGQTLYNLSKRFGVPVAAIMAANGISDPTTVKIGQSLVIPRYTYDRSASVSAPDADPNVRASTAGRGMIGEVEPGRVPQPAAPRSQRVASATPVQAAPVARAEPARPAFSASRTVTVGSGDTLYAIARRSGTTIDAIRAANALPGDAIRVGQVLRLPGEGAPIVAAPPTTQVAAAPRREEPTARRVVPDTVVARAAPKSLPRTNPPELDPIQTASIEPTAAVAAAQSDGALRRPVDGRVIRRFGGAQKGIDIQVPSGSPVRAAENGTVIYAGSGLKEFGKTVLIQHADGLVTVYGHADALKVAKGQTVRRGDVIASSGMTGEAESPRVHFQVRKGSTPVDPETFL